MPFNGSGTYVPPGLPVYPPASGNVISSNYFIQLMTDVFNALSVTFLRDGSVPFTGDINANANNLKGLASGTAATPSIRFSADATTGFYLNGSGKLCLAVGGSKVAEFTATGIVFTATVPVVLAYAATMTPDFLAGINFTIAMTGNATLANPTNLTAGQSGFIRVSQDATGSRTLAYGNYWKFAGGTPALSTAANSVDVIAYQVVSSTEILATLAQRFA